MILKSKRQVVIINDIKSDQIEQAIFILRDNNNASSKYFSKNSVGIESDIVLEAHRIINGFLNSNSESVSICEKQKKPVKSIKAQSILWLASSMAVIGTALLILTRFS